jgi:hypothetical protein
MQYAYLCVRSSARNMLRVNIVNLDSLCINANKQIYHVLPFPLYGFSEALFRDVFQCFHKCLVLSAFVLYIEISLPPRFISELDVQT